MKTESVKLPERWHASSMGLGEWRDECVLDKDGMMLAKIMWKGEKGQAIANMMAAAPELLDVSQMIADLDACNDQRDRLELFDQKYGIKSGQGRFNAIFKKAHAAIAKALEGK